MTRAFNGMEIQPVSGLSVYPLVKIDRTRVEGTRSIWGKDSFVVTGRLGVAGEDFPVSRAFGSFGEAWEKKIEIDARIYAARVEEMEGRHEKAGA